MEYLSKNRGRNCLDKWSDHKLSYSQMDQHYDLNYFILIHCAFYHVKHIMHSNRQGYILTNLINMSVKLFSTVSIVFFS